MTTATTTDLVPVLLTAEQLRVVHAALFKAADICRDKQLHYLEMHESPKIGPITSAEAWQTFKAWEGKETTCSHAIDVIQAAATAADVELPFSSYGMVL